MSIFATDGVGSVLHRALNGITFRQNVIADNIANVDTPGFRATSVDFESSLLAAIQRGQMPAAGLAPVTEASNAPVGSDGNNVDLRQESLSAVQTQFQYQMMSRAVSDRFALVSAAAGAF